MFRRRVSRSKVRSAFGGIYLLLADFRPVWLKNGGHVVFSKIPIFDIGIVIL
jgi:hypothetical protein